MAVAVTLIVVNAGSDNGATPPRFQAGPGRYRITVPSNAGGHGNVTYPPNVTVGTVRSLVILRGVQGDAAHPRAGMQFSVGQSSTDGSSYAAQRGCDCRTGQRLTVGTLRFAILHVWQEPGSGHDAVDIEVASTS